MPKQSKTFSTSFRGEVIDLAIVARWFIKQGIIPRSRNELINSAVKNFAGLITKNNPELLVTTPEDAYDIFEQLNLVGAHRKAVFPIEQTENWEVENLDLSPVPGFEPELTTKAEAANTSAVAGQLGNLATLLERRRKQDQSITEALASTHGLPIEEEDPTTEDKELKTNTETINPEVKQCD
jgi:hypothetical protein